MGLIGKIYWIDDTFNYTGKLFSDDANASHTSARIENLTISAEIIEFHVVPFTVDGETLSYKVNMHKNSVGIKYNGSFKDETHTDNMGAIACELFENADNFLIYGSWIERGHHLTFWVISSK